MKDKKLEMFEEIQKIKEREQRQFINQNRKYQINSELSKIDYQNIRLEHQLKIIDSEEKLINNKLAQIKKNCSQISASIASSSAHGLNTLNLDDNLTKLENQELRFYERLKHLNNQKTELIQLSNKLKLRQLEIISALDSSAEKEVETKNYTIKKTKNETSPNFSTLTKEDKEIYLLKVSRDLFLNNITIGNAIKKLRTNILKINQEQFAKLVGVSRKTISDIENNRGNLSIETLSAIARPFNLRLALLPTSSATLEKLLDTH
ncbi:helix-turn-helix transcriptional regulator [Providencia rettgeri]|uniref:helix-turn-helix transcriptional regulator n=1 Tax=Providencia rettgeri TaxID=587 RepID=UPI0034E0CD9D